MPMDRGSGRRHFIDQDRLIDGDVADYEGLHAVAFEELEQFQEKCGTVFRPELRKNKEIERFRDSEKNGTALEIRCMVKIDLQLHGAAEDRAQPPLVIFGQDFTSLVEFMLQP